MLSDDAPNTVSPIIALKIFFIRPVSQASDERSFCKLMLIKTYFADVHVARKASWAIDENNKELHCSKI
jgi:hypothetical protein